MIETGTTLQQRYKIDKQIGQGGMGAVYVATDERFGSVVAIKETLCMDDNFRKAIEREARLLNSLKHVALPRVSDHFEESNGQFLVMEYIPGDDVSSMLEGEHGAFSVDQVLKWADQLLDALDYLHNQNIPVIHRDIKPQNLKINSRGQIILLDFGLAKGNPTDAGHQTAAKSIFGYSRNYASLEQIQGTGTDPRSDLYSLAATLYHLLTGNPPEDALTRAMSVLSAKPDPLVPANAVNPEVPAGIAGILHNALDLNASSRPASATEMRRMLNESESYAYLTESTVSSIFPTQESAQATKIMSDATRAGVIKQTDIKTEVLPADMSELTSLTPGRTRTGPSHLTASPPQGRRGFALAAGLISVLLVGAAVGGIYVMKPSTFGIGTGVENATTLPVAAEPAAPTNVNLAVPAGQDAALAAPPDSQTDKIKESVKTKKTETTANPKTNPDDSSEPERTDSGDTTTQTDNGRVTTIRDNPNDRPSGVRPPPYGMEPGGPDPAKMTPEQRRRMLVLRNGQRPPPMGQRPPPMRPRN